MDGVCRNAKNARDPALSCSTPLPTITWLLSDLGCSNGRFENGCVSPKQRETLPFPLGQSRDWHSSVTVLVRNRPKLWLRECNSSRKQAVNWNPLMITRSTVGGGACRYGCRLKQAFQRSLHESTFTPGSGELPPPNPPLLNLLSPEGMVNCLALCQQQQAVKWS